jgi:hypothetical protein
MQLKRKNFNCKREEEGFSLTTSKRIQSLGLFDETIDLMHLVKPGFSPAFGLDYLLHFLPKRLHVLWEGSQVVECVHESLQHTKFYQCRFNAKVGNNHSPLKRYE